MELKKILIGLDNLKAKGNLDIDIKNIECDSRKVTKDTLFVAITGYDVDGHDFIDDAINNGATAVIVENVEKLRNSKKMNNATIIVTDNSRHALAIASCNFYDNPSRKFKLIGITGNSDSALAHEADIVQVFPSFEEACHLGLAPTSSTTVTLCYGDALAVVASEIYGFKDVDFSKFHPAGTLGKKLTIRVKDIMALGVDNSIIKEKSTLKDAIVELSKKGLGIVSVIDDENNLKGVITDGDLRRQLDKGADIYSLNVEDAMSVHPVTVDDDRLAIAALMLMKEKNISCLPVLHDGKVVGTLRLQDVLGVGIVG